MKTEEIVQDLREKAEVEGNGSLFLLLNAAADRLELYDGYTKALRFLTGVEENNDNCND